VNLEQLRRLDQLDPLDPLDPAVESESGLGPAAAVDLDFGVDPGSGLG
jgi:hypothetical protein